MGAISTVLPVTRVKFIKSPTIEEAMFHSKHPRGRGDATISYGLISECPSIETHATAESNLPKSSNHRGSCPKSAMFELRYLQPLGMVPKTP